MAYLYTYYTSSTVYRRYRVVWDSTVTRRSGPIRFIQLYRYYHLLYSTVAVRIVVHAMRAETCCILYDAADCMHTVVELLQVDRSTGQ